MKNSFQKFDCEGWREPMGSRSVMGVVRIERKHVGTLQILRGPSPQHLKEKEDQGSLRRSLTAGPGNSGLLLGSLTQTPYLSAEGPFAPPGFCKHAQELHRDHGDPSRSLQPSASMQEMGWTFVVSAGNSSGI